MSLDLHGSFVNVVNYLGFLLGSLDVIDFCGIKGENIGEIKDSEVVGHRISVSSYVLA